MQTRSTALSVVNLYRLAYCQDNSAETTTTAGIADTAAIAQLTSRQPPTAIEVTAATPQSPTLATQGQWEYQAMAWLQGSYWVSEYFKQHWH